MEYWNVGMMEYWWDFYCMYNITQGLQHSIAPTKYNFFYEKGP